MNRLPLNTECCNEPLYRLQQQTTPRGSRAARAAGTKRPRQPAPAGAAFNAATYSVAPIIADARARRRDEI